MDIKDAIVLEVEMTYPRGKEEIVEYVKVRCGADQDNIRTELELLLSSGHVAYDKENRCYRLGGAFNYYDKKRIKKVAEFNWAKERQRLLNEL
ncbi:MAG: hypothetical protein GY795_44755 [Desulfobacterales bacterium]|nr:hypothetical protein [Desulfobacterales bacterium]